MGSDSTQGSPSTSTTPSPSSKLPLLPWPKRVVAQDGTLNLVDVRLLVSYSQTQTPRLRDAFARLSQTFAGSRGVKVDVHCADEGGRYPELRVAESYRLRVRATGIDIWADTEWGVLNALSTLWQLTAAGPELPCCEIEDEPRFPWRGLLVDVARHYIGMPALRRTIDGMAACKLNVLHLHLTDDQAFRFPSLALPLPDERQYSRRELREIVDYAAMRGVRVVPEIDLPGHCTALLAGHPRLGSQGVERSRRFGVHEGCLDPSRESVYAAIADLLAEVAEVFPDRYLHIGGDEVHPAWWQASPEIVEFMRAGGIADVPALQAQFVNRVAGLVRDLGRVPMGWDEVLHPDLADPMVVQVWRGASARDRALHAGHSCVISANYYLDLFFPADVHYGFDPAAPMTELLAREDALLEDPRLHHIADGMRWTLQWRDDTAVAPNAAKLESGLLGGEACLWSELVTESVLDIRLWTRLPAVAERFWSTAGTRDEADLYLRLDRWVAGLTRSADIDVRASFRERMAAAGVDEPFIALVEMLEPVKWYARLLGDEALSARLSGREMPLARPYDLDSPLDRVVDGLFPESLAVREVAGVCQLVDSGSADARAQLLAMAARWQVLADRGDCPAELVPSATQLGRVAKQLTAYLQGERDAAATLRELRALNEPQGEYVLALVPMLCGWLEQAA